MARVAVVYWSGSGNTEAMANAVVEGAKEKGADVSLFFCSDFNEGMVGDYDAIAFGCPAMGAEVLEEAEFEPMFTACGPKLGGKNIALLAPMAGAPASGCTLGKTSAQISAQYWQLTA